MDDQELKERKELKRLTIQLRKTWNNYWNKQEEFQKKYGYRLLT